MITKLKVSEIEDALEKLNILYSYFRDQCGNKDGVDVLVSECVASGVSAFCDTRDWSQRYFVSLINRKYPPSKLAYDAIVCRYEKMLRDQRKSLADSKDTARLFPIQVVLTRTQYDEVLAIEDTKLRGEIFIEAVRNYNMVQRVLKLKEKK